MSLVEKILLELSKSSLSYKGIRVNLFGIPEFKNFSKNSLKSTLTRLHTNGFIENNNTIWRLTPTGRHYIKIKMDSLKNFNYNFPKDSPRNLIVMFDIPETQKAEREWFRWHLKKFNYKMIQKSVWVGPSPLPREFQKYLEKIKLKDKVKTFKLARSYQI
jgi:DNA-binding transcriptional regulator PaaX